MNLNINEKKFAMNSVAVLSVVLTLFVFIKFVDAVSDLGRGDNNPFSTITVSGSGEAFAIPDVALINFTITNDGESVKEAQDKTTEAIALNLKSIRDLGILDKDIKTTSYTSTPKYSGVPCTYYSCRYNEQKIIGYTVSESIEVKLHDTSMTGAVLALLGENGVTLVYGPNYAIDDEDAVQALARANAIDMAKEKAKILAKDLDVKLVQIVSFQENGEMPYNYMGNDSFMAMEKDASSIPEVPLGENKFTSSVSITYEIR